MNTVLTHLQALCALPGVSGREEAVRTYILDQLGHARAGLEVTTDPLGNVLVKMAGRKRAARRVLLDAHMDEVGLIVTGVTDEGFVRFAPVGGIDPAVLFGKRVLANGHPGVIGGKAVHQCSADEKRTATPCDKLLIDLGADSREAALALVRPGDTVVFDSPWTLLENERVQARALDDRVGCALLLALAADTPAVDLCLSFSVQEEVGLRGAKTAAFTLQPDVAVAIDATTAADIPGGDAENPVCRVGGGPVVSFMDNGTLYDAALYNGIRALAAQRDIPTQTKTRIAGGNDAAAIQRAGTGARVAAISLPCRYIHAPHSVLALEDVRQTAALLDAVLPSLAGGVW